jgi:molecular chaperone DnaK (HSP70)
MLLLKNIQVLSNLYFGEIGLISHSSRLGVCSLLLLPVLSLMPVNDSRAEIYRWVDENGKVHFTDKPRENSETIKLKAPAVKAEGTATPDVFSKEEKALNVFREKERLKKEAREEFRKEAKKEYNKERKAQKKRERREQCKRAKKNLANKKEDFRRHKRAGITLRAWNNYKRRIEQLENKAKDAC